MYEFWCRHIHQGYKRGDRCQERVNGGLVHGYVLSREDGFRAICLRDSETGIREYTFPSQRAYDAFTQEHPVERSGSEFTLAVAVKNFSFWKDH